MEEHGRKLQVVTIQMQLLKTTFKIMRWYEIYKLSENNIVKQSRTDLAKGVFLG